MSARRRAARAALALALAGAALGACGVRLETPPPQVPTADAAEHARQQGARAAHDLHLMARSAREATSGDVPAADGVVEALIAVETAATGHHEALGGVWEPWPGAGPEATAYPSDDGAPPAAPARSTPQEVLTLLETTAAGAREAAIGASGELAQILAAVAISRTYLAEDLAAALSAPAAGLPAEPLPVPEPGGIDPATSRALDAARYAFEVVAARSTEDQRAAAVERAAQLAAVSGAVAPEQDEREVAYDVTLAAAGQGTTPERALAAAAELDVVGAYVARLAGEVEDRGAVLAAATYAAGEARGWDTALPALPGLS